MRSRGRPEDKFAPNSLKCNHRERTGDRHGCASWAGTALDAFYVRHLCGGRRDRRLSRNVFRDTVELGRVERALARGPPYRRPDALSRGTRSPTGTASTRRKGARSPTESTGRPAVVFRDGGYRISGRSYRYVVAVRRSLKIHIQRHFCLASMARRATSNRNLSAQVGQRPVAPEIMSGTGIEPVPPRCASPITRTPGKPDPQLDAARLSPMNRFFREKGWRLAN